MQITEGHPLRKGMDIYELASLAREPINSVGAKSWDAVTDKTYGVWFVNRDDGSPYIKIDTEQRGSFLQEGTEREAQDALVKFATKIRDLTGGFFDIHPFYGAVYGTRLTPVAPNFMTEIEGLDDRLSMIIYMSEEKSFDSRLTKLSREIGTTVVFPSSQARMFKKYLEASATANPNQQNRDQAIVNGLKKPWEEQFREFNRKTKPVKVVMTPQGVAGVLSVMERVGIKSSVDQVHFD